MSKIFFSLISNYVSIKSMCGNVALARELEGVKDSITEAAWKFVGKFLVHFVNSY